MGNETGFLRDGGPLSPSVPQDIAARTQRQRILDGMAECVAEKTFSATTIADIVAEAGISRATFYKHFPNKQECFEAAADEFVERLRSAVAGAYASADPGPERVRKGIATVLELLAAQPAYARLLVIEAILVDASLIDRYRSILVKALEIPRKEGSDPRGSGKVRSAYGQAQVLLANQVLDGRTADLPELLPDLVYIALSPFVGQAEALKQAQLAR